jgi:hypothetical protein
VLLLEYAYSDAFEKRDILLSSVIKQSGIKFGIYFHRAILRHSVAAISAALLPKDDFENHLQWNTHQANQELNVVLRGEKEILDSDVVAAFLLGLLAVLNKRSADQIELYANACRMMLGLFFANSKDQSSSQHMLANFGPLILDWLEILHLRQGDQLRWYKTFQLRRHLFNDLTNFEQRLRYFQSGRQGWSSVVGRAVKYTLSILSEKLICILPIVAKREHDGNFGKEGIIEDILQSVKREFDHPSFQHALAETEKFKDDTPTRYLPF